MEIRGNATSYSGATTHRPLPHASAEPRRGTHAPQPARKAGIDFDALRPKCKGCSQPSSQLNNDSLCPDCRGDIPLKTIPPNVTAARGHTYTTLPEDELAVRFTGDNTRLGRELAELEATDPKVAEAAELLDHEIDRIIHPEDHVDPTALEIPELPEADNQGQPTTRRSAPRATSPSSTTGRAPVAGTATHRENPPATRETRPAVAGGPTPAQELDAQVAHVTRVLRETADLTNPAARMLRLNALSAIEALYLFTQMYPETTEPGRGLGGTPEGGASKGKAARPPATPRNGRKGPRGPHTGTNVTGILEHYAAGHSIPEVSEIVGHARGTVRNILLTNGVQLRDDRKGHSGGKPKEYPADLVTDVRRLYLEESLTIDQVAERLNTTHKTVAGIMHRNDIPRRPGAHVAGLRPGADHAIGLKTQITALGVTSRQIKEWALANGLVEDIRVGLPSARLVDAYAAAHPITEEIAS